LEHGSCLEKLKRYAKINEICESLQFLSQTSLSMAKSKIKPTENKGKIVVVQAVVADPIAHIKGSFFNNDVLKSWIPVSVVIMVLSYVLYFQCITYGYVLDDLLVIQENKFTKQGFGGVWDIFTTESFTGYFGEKKELVQGNRYRPLSIATFAVEYGMFGKENPVFSHFINILLYGLTGILLWMVLAPMFRNFNSNKWWFSVPFVATLIFIAHPIHTEAVANIKGRDEIMAMLFSLGALYGAMRFVDHSSPKWLSISMVSYFLGLLSKENAITFFAIIPLSIYFFSKPDWSKLGKLGMWLLITTVLYLVLRFNMAGVPKFSQEIKDIMNNPFLGMKPDQKLGSIMYTLLKYIQLMVWPHPLSHDYYPYAIPKISVFKPVPLLSLLTYIGLVILAFRGWRQKSVYSYSIWFYLLALTIVSNFVINLGTFMNERFIFMASAGFCIAVAYFLLEHLPALSPKYGYKAGLTLTFVAILGYGAKTFVRVPVWKDALSLNEAAVAISSNSARANSFLATALFEKFKVTENIEEKRKLIDRTEKYAQKAVDILPDYLNGNLMVLGVVSERYKFDRDIKKYIEGIRPVILRRPDIGFIKEFSEYLKGSHNTELFPFYLEVGQELMKFNDMRRNYSIDFLKYAYEIQPANKQVNIALGQAYEINGNAAEAARFKAAAQSLQ
jgi:hypothetical protein